MNKIIHTAIVGEGYKLREPEKVCEGWDYICTTDQDIKSDVWKIEQVPPEVMQYDHSNRWISRVRKILSFNREHSVSIYIDAKFRPINDLDSFVEKNLGENDIALLEHNKRTCVYKEAKFIAANKIEPWENMQAQIGFYLNEGLPKDYGLWAPGIMIKRHNEKMDAFNKFWWKSYVCGCDRDMLSLTYSIWSLTLLRGLKVGLMPFRATYKRWRK